MNYQIDCTKLSDCLTMSDVLEKYHHIGKNGRTNCPLHQGTHNNFCYTDAVFHCWTCGAKGNIVGFVKQLFHLSFKQALAKLDYDFNLNLHMGSQLSYREQQQARKAYKQAKEDRQKKEEEKQAKERAYWALWDEWIRLDINKMKYAPKTPNEKLHPLFIEALQKLSYQEYLINEKAVER